MAACALRSRRLTGVSAQRAVAPADLDAVAVSGNALAKGDPAALHER
jgi:hypothetical protein